MSNSGQWSPDICYKIGDLVAVTDSSKIYYAKISEIDTSITDDPVYRLEWFCQLSKIKYGDATHWVTSNSISRAAEA